MSDSYETRASLLLRLVDSSDHTAWEEFTSIYWPVIYRLARRRGLQDADAQDLAQKILVILTDKIADWKPTTESGAFRGWLATITRNVTLNMLTRRKQDAPRGGTGVMEQMAELSEPANEDREFDLEYRRSLFRRAADEIQSEFHPATWKAFWFTTVDGMSVEEASDRLEVQIGSIYTGRSRVMKRLKLKIKELETSVAE